MTIAYRLSPILLLCLFAGHCAAQNQLPEISNIRFEDNAADRILTIRYDVSDQEEPAVEILFRASFDEGTHFLVNTSDATGDVGYPVATGANREIRWYYGEVWDRIEGKTLRLIADDGFEIDPGQLIEQVDTSRMRRMLEFLCDPRSFQVNTEHLFRVRDTLAHLVESHGYQLKLQEFQHLGRTATNVIGRKPGLGNERLTYIMDAHYDGNIDAPGADDNASGVVGFLEALYILAPYHFDRSIEFIGFDQEEEGLLGSITYAWLGGIEPWKEIGGVLNYEMIGYYSELPNSQQVPLGFDLLFEDQYQQLIDDEFRGDFIFVTGNDASVELVTAFESSSRDHVPGLEVISAIAPLNGIIAPDLLRSDHAPFWFKGLPAVMITDGSEFRNHNYHTPNDVLDSLNMEFMGQVTQAGLGALIELAGIRHAAVETFEVAFTITGLNDAAALPCDPAIYPNPAHSSIRYDLSECVTGRNELVIRIYDISGRKITEQSVTGVSGNLDVSGLDCGTYLFEAVAESRFARRQLLIH